MRRVSAIQSMLQLSQSYVMWFTCGLRSIGGRRSHGRRWWAAARDTDPWRAARRNGSPPSLARNVRAPQTRPPYATPRSHLRAALWLHCCCCRCHFQLLPKSHRWALVAWTAGAGGLSSHCMIVAQDCCSCHRSDQRCPLGRQTSVSHFMQAISCKPSPPLRARDVYTASARSP